MKNSSFLLSNGKELAEKPRLNELTKEKEDLVKMTQITLPRAVKMHSHHPHCEDKNHLIRDFRDAQHEFTDIFQLQCEQYEQLEPEDKLRFGCNSLKMNNHHTISYSLQRDAILGLLGRSTKEECHDISQMNAKIKQMLKKLGTKNTDESKKEELPSRFTSLGPQFRVSNPDFSDDSLTLLADSIEKFGSREREK